MTILPDDRDRRAWWAFTLAMVGVLLFVLWSFVGTVVFGVFLYYGMRPLDRRLRERLSSDRAADATLLLVALPILGLVTYTFLLGVQALNQLPGVEQSVVAQLPPWVRRDPVAVAEQLPKVFGPEPPQGEREELVSAVVSGLAAAANGLAHFLLSLLLAFVLLREDGRLAAWYRGQFGPEGSAAYAYALAVDRDLHDVYVGNVLTVFVVTTLGLVVYNALNAVAPPNLAVPVPTLLALLTGLATLIPLVVGKVVYVPVGVFLVYRATTGPGTGPLWFPVAFFVVCFLLLDLLPVAILRPYIAGRNVHGGLMVFAYVGGGMLFGWYGLFLGPLLVVLGVHLARIVVPELVHGEPVTYEVETAESLGATPEITRVRADEDDADAAGDPDPETDGRGDRGAESRDRTTGGAEDE